MKKIFLIGLVALPIFASENCYQLSQDGNLYSRTPELLCVKEDNTRAEITLKTGLPFNAQTVAVFNLDLLQRVRCIDCNEDVFGLSIPSNSIFNNLKISFKGRGMGANQTGTIDIGSNRFYYRSAR